VRVRLLPVSGAALVVLTAACTSAATHARTTSPLGSAPATKHSTAPATGPAAGRSPGATGWTLTYSRLHKQGGLRETITAVSAADGRFALSSNGTLYVLVNPAGTSYIAASDPR
jgi:hypothetical protein